MSRVFGPYICEMQEHRHVVVRRYDDQPVDLTWYELQHIKSMMFGGSAYAVEIFPAMSDVVDGQNQRHLWWMDKNKLPNLRDINDSDNGREIEVEVDGE